MGNNATFSSYWWYPKVFIAQSPGGHQSAGRRWWVIIFVSLDFVFAEVFSPLSIVSLSWPTRFSSLFLLQVSLPSCWVGVSEQLGGGLTAGWGQPATTCFRCGTVEEYKPLQLKFPLDSLRLTSEFDLVIFILFYFI